MSMSGDNQQLHFLTLVTVVLPFGVTRNNLLSFSNFYVSLLYLYLYLGLDYLFMLDGFKKLYDW